MKRKKPIYNTHRCKGINNAIALLDSDRFQIVEVCIARLSAASKNKMVNQMISGYKVNYMDKDQFYKKYPTKKVKGFQLNSLDNSHIMLYQILKIQMMFVF